MEHEIRNLSGLWLSSAAGQKPEMTEDTLRALSFPKRLGGSRGSVIRVTPAVPFLSQKDSAEQVSGLCEAQFGPETERTFSWRGSEDGKAVEVSHHKVEISLKKIFLLSYKLATYVYLISDGTQWQMTTSFSSAPHIIIIMKCFLLEMRENSQMRLKEAAGSCSHTGGSAEFWFLWLINLHQCHCSELPHLPPLSHTDQGPLRAPPLSSPCFLKGSFPRTS